MKKRNNMISIVMPAYKEEGIIEKSLLETVAVMDKIGSDYEIICVVDGKLDDTERNAKRVMKKHPDKVKVFSYRNNAGKGHAVRYGFAKVKGDIVGFFDAGFDINHQAIEMLLLHLKWYNADIIVGSKRHPASKVNYPWQRRIISFGSQFLVRLLFGLKIKDTQVGIKFFRREVLEAITPRLLVKEWAFDIEILAVSNYLGFKRIFEAPIELKLDFNKMSAVISQGFFRILIKALWDTVAIFYRLYILRYYNDSNKPNWITPKYLTLNKK
ncbi:glycosyltransferase [Patescibacteria group bacterium]